jgi:D-lactate dehydrogenase (cytochrome)
MLTVKAIILFNDKQKPLAEEVVHRMVVNAVEMEGTVTGEHGVGLIKRDYLPHELGEATVDVMRKVSDPSPLSMYNTDLFQVEIRAGSVVSAQL